MCGIYGEVCWRGGVDPGAAWRAADAIRHRGPDDEGYLLASTRHRTAVLVAGPDSVRSSSLHIGDARSRSSDPDAAIDVVLAFRRLAIVDLSALGAQPMGSADGLTWIVFNGEIYNHVELRRELEAAGHRFVGGSDTEVLLAAYREWGEDCVRRLNGMWAFCLLDLRRPEAPLLLSRDRFGEKPLFLQHGPHGLRFASEIKSLVTTSDLPFQPDHDAVVRYLATGAMPSPTGGATFFQGITQLPPASCCSIGPSGIRQWRYWELPPPPSGRVPLQDAAAELRGLIDESVRIRLRADVPVGTCLSGGVDSSAIATTMARIGGPDFDRQHTFTAAYDVPGRHDEREHVEKVLAVLSAMPTMTFPTVDGLAEDLDALTWHQDEPFGSSSIFAQWCVMRAASQAGVRVILDGQGADELFGGYRPFAYSIADTIRSGRIMSAWQELAVLGRELGMPVRPQALKALALAAGATRGRRLHELLRRRRPAPPVLADGVSIPADPQIWADGPSLDLLDAHLRRATLESSLPELLRYEDRNSMAHSIESRTPFLDVHLAEAAFTGAAPHRSAPPWTKHVLRLAVEDRVPADIVWRRDKVGFETPQQAWRPVLQRLLAERAPGSPAAALIDVDACVTGRVDDRSLWRALNLVTWWDVFAHRAASGPSGSHPVHVA